MKEKLGFISVDAESQLCRGVDEPRGLLLDELAQPAPRRGRRPRSSVVGVCTGRLQYIRKPSGDDYEEKWTKNAALPHAVEDVQRPGSDPIPDHYLLASSHVRFNPSDCRFG